MPPSCISLHQLLFPDFLTACRSLVSAEATARWFNLITAQLASPEGVIQHVCHLYVTAPAWTDNSAAILVTHVKFRSVNYSCAPFLPCPRLISFSSPSWSKLDCCEIIQKPDRYLPPPLLPLPLLFRELCSFPKVAIISLSRRSCQALLGLTAFMLATTDHSSPVSLCLR